MVAAASLGVLGLGFAAHLRVNWGVVAVGQLYRSAQPTAARIRQLAVDPGIRTIVNLRGEWPNAGWYRAERAAAKELGIEVHDVPLFTHRLAPMEQLRKLVRIYDEAPKPILLHCHRGSDRTSLAAALYRALCLGDSLAEASTEYRLWHGHTGWARGAALPHLFDVYERWLAERGQTHSAGNLREWITSTPTIAHYAAYIECPNLPKSVPTGKALSLRFFVTNQSASAWHAGDPMQRGVHFWLWIHRDGDGVDSARRMALPQRRVEPGATVALDVELSGFDRPGQVQLTADLHDIDELKFREMGQGGWNAVLDVVENLAAAPPPARR